MERKLGIKRQWQPRSAKYIKLRVSIEKKKTISLLKKLHSHAMEYRFVSNLKKKYSGELPILFSSLFQ